MIKKISQWALALFIIQFCLGHHITFVKNEPVDDSHEVVIEFRQVRLDSPADADPGKYTLMLQEKGADAFQSAEQFWVAHGSEIRAVKSDIQKSLIRQTRLGNWLILIVFEKDFSEQLVAMSENNVGREIAIVINGRLITVPVLNSSLASYLDRDGRFHLAIPTQFHAQAEIDQFLTQYHL